VPINNHAVTCFTHHSSIPSLARALVVTVAPILSEDIFLVSEIRHLRAHQRKAEDLYIRRSQQGGVRGQSNPDTYFVCRASEGIVATATG
jgi:hypothetical protein